MTDNPRNRSPLKSALAMTRHVFGYDFFISYSHGDAEDYAVQLHGILVGLGYRVFIDKEELHAGLELTPAITAALRRSSTLIAIVSHGAIERSWWVEKEVRLFSETMRTVVAITLGSNLEDEAGSSTLLDLLGERLRLTETVAAGASQPSQKIVNQLAKALAGPRIERRRMYALMGISAVFAALAALAVLFGIAEQASRFRAEEEAISARSEAATRYAIAAKAALASRPEEAMQLARRAVSVFRDAGDPLVAPAVSALEEVVQSVAGQSLGQSDTILKPDGSAMFALQDDDILWRYDRPGELGLGKRARVAIPPDIAGDIDSMFLLENEIFVMAYEWANDDESSYSVYRLADWQLLHRFKTDYWDTRIEICGESGKLAVVREDSIELLDVRYPDEIRLTLPLDRFDAFMQFSGDCRWLLSAVDEHMLIADTERHEVRKLNLAGHPPLDAVVTDGNVLILDASGAVNRLTQNGPQKLGGVFETHNELVTARGVAFAPYNLSGRIEIGPDQDAILARYRIVIDDNVGEQGIGMASLFSLSGEAEPRPILQNNPEMFGQITETSSSSYNDEQQSSNLFEAKDTSRLGVWDARFLDGSGYVITLGFSGDLIVHGDVHQRIRLAEQVSTFTVSPNHHWIVTGHENGDIKFWELDGAEPGSNEATFVWHGHDAAVVDIQFDASAPLLISEDQQGNARYWHQADPRLGPDVQQVSSIDGRFLATTDLYENYYVWDLKKQDPFAAPLGVDDLPLRNIAFGPTHAVTLHPGSTPGSARLHLWNLTVQSPFAESILFELKDERWIEYAQNAYKEHPRMFPGSAWMELLENDDEFWLLAGTNQLLTQYLLGVVRLDSTVNKLSLDNSILLPRELRAVIVNDAGDSFTTIDSVHDVLLWQFKQGADGPTPVEIEVNGRVNRLEFSPDSARLLVGTVAGIEVMDLATASQTHFDLADGKAHFSGHAPRLISEQEGVLTIHDSHSGTSQMLTIEPELSAATVLISQRGTDALILDTVNQAWWVAVPQSGFDATALPLPSLPGSDNLLTAFEVGETALVATLEGGELVIWYRDNSGVLSDAVVISEPILARDKEPSIKISADNGWVMVNRGGAYRVRPLSLDRLTAAARSGRDHN